MAVEPSKNQGPYTVSALKKVLLSGRVFPDPNDKNRLVMALGQAFSHSTPDRSDISEVLNKVELTPDQRQYLEEVVG